MNNLGIKPCPFCGKEFDDLDDYLYPTGSWRWDAERERMYHGTVRDYCDYKDQYEALDWEIGLYYTMHCQEHNGGCSAEVTGKSLEDCIAKWNKRIN